MSPQQQRIRTIVKAASGAAIVLTLAVSCEKKGDPSYDKEVLKLTAEKAALEAKFEAMEKKLKEAKPASSDSAPVIAKLEAEIADLKKMLAEKPKSAPAAGNTPAYDLQAIKLGFMTGVEKLKENLEAQNPDYRIDSVTLEKLQLPSSKPFASGVSMKVVSKSTGQTIPFRWQGIGSIDGTWTFEKASNQVATNTPAPTTPRTAPPVNNGGIKVTRITGNGNNGHRTVTPTGQPAPQPRQPTGQPAPRQPQPAPTPAPPRRPIRTDGNTHQVDWDNLNK